MFLRKYSKNEKSKNRKNSERDNIEKIDKKEFWLLVKAAYKAILPFVLIIILIYFIFTLVLTKIIIK